MSIFIRYDSVDQDGLTRRQRNISFEAPENNQEVKIPDEGAYLWGWFFQLVLSRPERGKPIPFSEIDAWSRLSGNALEPFEFEALIAMDRAYLSAMSDEIKHNESRQKARDDARSRLSGRK